VNIEELTVGQIKQIIAMFGVLDGMPKVHPATGKCVLVRTFSAGLHFGILNSAAGKEVHLTRSRRIWNWTGGALSCSEIASTGITGGRVAVEVQSMFLTEAVEIIPMTKEAEDCLRKF
jgi:hypothetical protein